MKRSTSSVRASLLCFGLTAVLAPGCHADADAHSLVIDFRLDHENGEVTLMTPNATVNSLPAEDIVGKPYYVSFFDAGFSIGADDPLHEYWGEVPEDLHIVHDTPPDFDPGPYDGSLVVFVQSEVVDQQLPNTLAGDLSSFTLGADEGEIMAGDPDIAPGFVRFNVEEDSPATRSISVANKWITDVDDQQAGLDAFTQTVLLVP